MSNIACIQKWHNGKHGKVLGMNTWPTQNTIAKIKMMTFVF